MVDTARCVLRIKAIRYCSPVVQPRVVSDGWDVRKSRGELDGVPGDILAH